MDASFLRFRSTAFVALTTAAFALCLAVTPAYANHLSNQSATVNATATATSNFSVTTSASNNVVNTQVGGGGQVNQSSSTNAVAIANAFILRILAVFNNIFIAMFS